MVEFQVKKEEKLVIVKKQENTTNVY